MLLRYPIYWYQGLLFVCAATGRGAGCFRARLQTVILTTRTVPTESRDPFCLLRGPYCQDQEALDYQFLFHTGDVRVRDPKGITNLRVPTGLGSPRIPSKVPPSQGPVILG